MPPLPPRRTLDPRSATRLDCAALIACSEVLVGGVQRQDGGEATGGQLVARAGGTPFGGAGPSLWALGVPLPRGAALASEQAVGSPTGLARVLDDDLPGRDLLHGDGQRLVGVHLLDQRRGVLAQALAEGVVVVVDLTRAACGQMDEGVLAVNLVEQRVDGGDGDQLPGRSGRVECWLDGGSAGRG